MNFRLRFSRTVYRKISFDINVRSNLHLRVMPRSSGVNFPALASKYTVLWAARNEKNSSIVDVISYLREPHQLPNKASPTKKGDSLFFDEIDIGVGGAPLKIKRPRSRALKCKWAAGYEIKRKKRGKIQKGEARGVVIKMSLRETLSVKREKPRRRPRPLNGTDSLSFRHGPRNSRSRSLDTLLLFRGKSREARRAMRTVGPIARSPKPPPITALRFLSFHGPSAARAVFGARLRVLRCCSIGLGNSGSYRWSWFIFNYLICCIGSDLEYFYKLLYAIVSRIVRFIFIKT